MKCMSDASEACISGHIVTAILLIIIATVTKEKLYVLFDMLIKKKSHDLLDIYNK